MRAFQPFGNSSRRAQSAARFILAIAAAIACVLAFTAAPAGATARFTDGDMLSSDAGNAMIAWEADGPVSLSISRDGGPARSIYSGAARSFFVSGLADGEYRFVLHSEGGEESAPLTLAVEHQSMSRALLLVALGALAFLATVVVVLRGARDD